MFTLVKNFLVDARWLIMTIAALAFLFFLAACGDGSHTLTNDESMKAELGAVKYSQAAGYTYVSVSGLDSQSDGYVTATFKKSDGTIVEAVCSYKATGCKAK